ncbi:MAG: ATP phosphoribosyltransferase [Porticoccaceae bacterium]|jgi:ATP phosphoribosyltransferase|nr:ATP phosphoribosyltransferase [Porticoccaceae bacterium]
MITIALTKGRILSETLPLLAAAGIVPDSDITKSRKLIFETNREDIRLVVLRGSDVPTYVKRGSADLGIAGKDMLMETGGDNLYELLDLNIARCRLMTAAVKGREPIQGKTRVATKFTEVARRYYASQKRQVELVKLYGAMEVAPLLDLADEIVDIVDTGNTLIANGLEPLDLIADISSRLIVNKASFKIKNAQLMPIVENIQSELGVSQ